MLNVTDPTPSGTTRFFSVVLRDQNNAPGAPLQVFRTVYDMTSGEESLIAAEAAIAVTGPTLVFKTTDEENTIADPANVTEKRRVIIRAVFGVGDQLTDYADYTIRRIAPVID